MAEIPSRCVTFASRTVEAGDGDYDEISNEHVSRMRLIFMMNQNAAHMRTGIWICPRQYRCSW